MILITYKCLLFLGSRTVTLCTISWQNWLIYHESRFSFPHIITYYFVSPQLRPFFLTKFILQPMEDLTKVILKTIFGHKICQSAQVGVLAMFNMWWWMRWLVWCITMIWWWYTCFELLPNLGSFINFAMPSIIKISL